MENCLAAAALNGVDRRSLQRSAKLGQEVLERAKRRAVDWHSQERPKSSFGVISREVPYPGRRPAAGSQRLLPGEKEERHPTLSASFKTMAEFMDYTSSQCGKYYSSVPEEGGATHVYRYHRERAERHMCKDVGNGQTKDREKTSIGPGGTCQTSSALEASQPLGWHKVLLEFHHLLKQQEGPDPPAYKVKIIAEILKHIHLAENISKDLYIEVYPGTYSVTVSSNDLTKKTHVVAVDSGQSVDLVFPV